MTIRKSDTNVGDPTKSVAFLVLVEDRLIAIVIFALMSVLGFFLTWATILDAHASPTTGAFVMVGVALVIDLAAVLLPLYVMWRAKRLGELVIDPERGEIRVGRAYEIPFSRVRQIEVVEHHFTYRSINGAHDTVTAEMTGWALDIGGGTRLCGENGLSKQRVTEIADALRLRVEAYRARTKEGVAPLPAPSEVLLERIAGALKEQGEQFEADWLDLDGPMADEIRHFGDEPNESTMGPDGAFAKALRKAGYDLGDAGR
jgi:hypothetical protein